MSKIRGNPNITPVTYEPGDTDYVPEDDPPETFWLVVAAPEGTSEGLVLFIHEAYERMEPLQMPGRRYLVNARDEDDARAKIEPIEAQIAAHDEHEPWELALVQPADPLLHAGRE